MAAASERDVARGRSDGAPEAGRARSETSWLIQVFCLAFAALVVATDVGYCLSKTVFASRLGTLDASFDPNSGRDGYVRVERVEPGGAMARVGVAVGDRVAFDRPWDYLRHLTAGEIVGFTLDHAGRASHLRIIIPAPKPASLDDLRTGLALDVSLFVSALFGALIVWRSRRQATVLLLGMALATFGVAELVPPFWLSDLTGYEFGLAAFMIDVYWAVPVLFYAFALQFFQENAGPRRPWQKAAFWIYALVLLLLTAVRSFAWARAVALPVLGDVRIVENVVSDLGLAMCLAYLFLGWRRSNANEQQRYAFLLIGASAFVLAQLMNNFVDLFGTSFVAGTILANVVAPALFAYAILRHRVIDIGFAVNRTLIYAVVSAILLAAFGLIEWAADHFVPIEGREKNVLVDAAVAVGVFLTFHRVRDGVEHMIEGLFFRRWQRAESALRRFVKEAAFVSQPQALGRAFTHALADYAEGAQVAIYMAEAEGEGYARTEGEVAGAPARLDRDLPPLVSLRADPKPAEIHDGALAAALIAPMFNRNEVMAFVLLGPKSSGKDYRPDEIELIGWATRQVGLDLHALEVEQLKRELQNANAQITGMLRLSAQHA